MALTDFRQNGNAGLGPLVRDVGLLQRRVAFGVMRITLTVGVPAHQQSGPQMSSPEVLPLVDPVRTADDPASLTVCAACPHESALHDRIGSRFCGATIAGGLDRGCVCGDATATSATRWPGAR